MMSSKFFQAVLLSVLYASYASAVPSSSWSQRSTHLEQVVGRDQEAEVYAPPTTYETYGEGVDHPAVESFAKGDNLKASTLSFVSSKLGVDQQKISYKSGFKSDVAQYAYVKQSHNEIPIANAVANVVFKDDKVTAFGSSFVDTKKIADSTPSIDAKAAIAKAEAALNGKHNDWPTSLEYVAKSDGSVALAHVVQIRNRQAATWYQAYINAHDGSLISAVSFRSDASYTVLPISKTTLPEGQQTLVDPQDNSASPFGWHGLVDGSQTNDTSGNNVISFIGTSTNTTVQSSDGLIFDYPYNVTLEPSDGKNPDAARTNLFYLLNKIHDVAYRYGFTEAAHNFQQDNNGNGGVGNDRVLAYVQDDQGTNNAYFLTPADGQSGECHMFPWDFTTPQRDGSLENDIPIHEMAHGISNRMTGGGTGTCLTTIEARGLGEGWSDGLANWFLTTPTVDDFTVGTYVTILPGGIRSFPYSRDPVVNPLRYSSLQGMTEVHSIGEVWANMLHNVLAALVDKHGFSTEAQTNPNGTEGNVVWLHLFLDSLAVQPCNPTFWQARDAWLQADVNRYNSQHRCTLWGAFASRGLGVNAKRLMDDSTVPAECATSA